ncbi:Acidic amino acid decarboxylase GADL1 [Porphyridium purpureum]|uniref:Acidic amino acid decarboxylase GADL1 n=1 Tax=Porphyridium purpureum TaxID=35688 RepID=A0A5J4YQ26_PORPP|nr:Acidic amino acid decarboxylase GADL1 [Porphyridium purpureum]|eukprot:POR3920..scf222_8
MNGAGSGLDVSVVASQNGSRNDEDDRAWRSSVLGSSQTDASEMQQLMAFMDDKLQKYYNERAHVVDTDRPRLLQKYLTPSALEDIFDVRSSSFLPENSPPSSHAGVERVMDAVNELLEYSVVTMNPMFLNRLYAGSSPVGQIAELLIAVLNTSPDTYATAPALSVLQKRIIQHVGQRFGYDEELCNGTFCPGGSYSNLLAMTAARNVMFPDIRAHGMHAVDGGPLCVFTSVQAHYSIARAAMVLGIGELHVVKVPCDNSGAMREDLLEQQIQTSSGRPFLVCATAGTTVLGAYDNLEAISRICKRYNMWLHVDACYGGSVVLCEQGSAHRRLLRGVENADSIAWNPHKLLGVPLQCSILLTKQSDVLHGAISSGAEYLFHADHPETAYDSGDNSLQCGRRADVVKLWLSWKRYGTRGLRERVNNAISLALYCADRIQQKHTRFLLVVCPVSFNVCFWYVPEALTHAYNLLQGESEYIEQCGVVQAVAAGKRVLLSRSKGSPDIGNERVCRVAAPSRCHVCQALDLTTRKLYRVMQADGFMLINYSSLPDRNLPAFFRLILNSPHVLSEHLDKMLARLISLGDGMK